MRRYYYPHEAFAEDDEMRTGCWIKIDSPNTEDLEFLTETLGVPESFIADVADSDERPRIDAEEGWVLTIIRIPISTPDSSISFNTCPVGILYSPSRDLLTTICYHPNEMLTDFIRHSRRKKIVVNRDTDFIFRLIHSSSVWYLKYMKQISFLVMEAEEALQTSIQNDDLLRLMSFKKCLVYFSTSIKGNESVANKILASKTKGNYDQDVVDDMVIELQQAYNTVTIHAEILTGTMDAFASVINNNVNTIMKRMTSITFIFVLPTLISSIFGMNLVSGWEEIKGLFWIVTVISLVIAVVTFLILRRMKWF